jgi:hypothetical protein
VSGRLTFSSPSHRSVLNVPGIVQRLRRAMLRPVEVCTESHGGYIAYMLQMFSFSYNSQIKWFRTHVNTDIFLVLICGIRAQSLSAPFSYTLYSCSKILAPS